MAEFDSVIRPGGTGYVKTTVKTAGIQGERQKTITLDTNDPDRPVVVLKIRFESRPPVSVFPASPVSFDVIEGDAGKNALRILVMRRDDGEPLDAKLARNPFEGLEASIEPYAQGMETGGIEAEPGDAVVTLRWTGSTGPSFERSQLEFETDHPREPKLAVPVRVRFRASFMAHPAALRLDVKDLSRAAVSRTTVSSGRRKPFRIESVRLAEPIAGVSVATLSEERLVAHAVELRVQPGQVAEGVHRGEIEVLPRGKEAKPLRVPFVVSVPGATPETPR